jgi:hypothetical protein
MMVIKTPLMCSARKCKDIKPDNDMNPHNVQSLSMTYVQSKHEVDL